MQHQCSNDNKGAPCGKEAATGTTIPVSPAKMLWLHRLWRFFWMHLEKVILIEKRRDRTQLYLSMTRRGQHHRCEQSHSVPFFGLFCCQTRDNLRWAWLNPPAGQQTAVCCNQWMEFFGRVTGRQWKKHNSGRSTTSQVEVAVAVIGLAVCCCVCLIEIS